MNELQAKFQALFGQAAERVASAAGRVNLIGEHVDYCGGRVLPAALTLSCRAAYRKNGTGVCRIAATTLPEAGIVEIDLARTDAYRDLPWGSYQAGVAHVMREAGYRLTGCDILYDCNVPFGAGLSSSAAIEVVTAYILAVAGENPVDPVALAKLSQRAENSYCGVNCGIMDQFASANGKAGHAVLLDCATLAYEYVPLALQDCVLILTNCNKPHKLVESKYNERRGEVEEALSRLQTVLPVSCLAEVTPSDLERHKDLVSPTVYRRARHVVTECERVSASVSALKRGDLRAFGKLLNASHVSLRDDYEVTGRELDVLAEAAWECPACLGSRMTGAGFGGCTVSLVQKSGVAEFESMVERRYTAAIGYAPSFYLASIADGITEERI